MESVEIGIDPEMTAEIARLSGGYPHPVQLLGSECFEVDDDDYIDKNDEEDAVHAIVTERWKHEFDANYVEAGYGKNRLIIKAMATCDETDVPVSYICEVLGVTQPEISSNINTLMKRLVIVRTDRGVYRFRDPLFRVYVDTLNILGDEPVEHLPRKRTKRKKAAAQASSWARPRVCPRERVRALCEIA